MLLTIAAILVILWLLGIGFHVTVGLLHLLLFIALLVVLYDVLVARRR